MKEDKGDKSDNVRLKRHKRKLYVTKLLKVMYSELFEVKVIWNLL